MRKGTSKTSFHLVEVSIWLLVISIGVLGLTVGLVVYMHGLGGRMLIVGLLLVIMSMLGWFRDIVRESCLGYHVKVVQRGLKIGMMLFILSEVMFFFGFFWGWFWMCLSLSVSLGSQWLLVGIEGMEAYGLALLNTVILVSSGVTITYGHHSIIVGERKEALKGLIMTILLALVFTGLQIIEYKKAGFSISDSVYGSVFYMSTGFHGFHVLLGTIILVVSMFRVWDYSIFREHHIGVEAGIWYWHFVDVVWLFLFVCVYWFGS